VTERLLLHKFRLDPKVVKSVEAHDTIMIPLDPRGHHVATLTFVPANHCPGAVGVVLQGYFGTIFHTGDFRFSPEMFDQVPSLRTTVFDTVFVDNTYCNPVYKFPPRTVVAEEILQLIASHNDKRIIVGIDTLGKEELLVFLAEELHTRVVVSPARFENLRLLDLPDIFEPKDDFEGAFLYVISKNELSAPKYASPLSFLSVSPVFFYACSHLFVVRGLASKSGIRSAPRSASCHLPCPLRPTR